MAAIDVTVRLNGGLFHKNIPESVRRALVDEAVDKIGQRLVRKGAQGSGGRGIGVRRNTVTQDRDDARMTVTTLSTHIWPRMKGTSWQGKNVRIARSMAGRVLRKAADRVVAEMGGS